MTVTVCGVSQASGPETVKVRTDGLTVPSPGSVLVRAMVTSEAGSVSSTIVNVAVPPDSVVWSPETGLTVAPARSFWISASGSAVL